MAELYRFFNSTTTDRRLYQAEDFADFFSQFLSSGLVHTDNIPMLKVTAEGYDMTTRVESGSAIIKGHLYKNTSDLTLVHQPADPSYNRIDRIVLRYDGTIENRFIKAFVKTGLPAIVPVPPALERSDEVCELSLAQVLVKAGNLRVTQSEVTDERLEEGVCGLADSLITIPTNEITDSYEQFKSQLSDDFYAWFDDARKQSSVELLQEELKLIKKNQIELLMQQYLDGNAGEYDAGYFYDVLKDYSKIDTTKTTAKIDTVGMKATLPNGSTTASIYWNPHEIGFVASKVKHYHTRPIGKMIPVVESALSGQNKIRVANVEVTITEVIS